MEPAVIVDPETTVVVDARMLKPMELLQTATDKFESEVLYSVDNDDMLRMQIAALDYSDSVTTGVKNLTRAVRTTFEAMEKQLERSETIQKAKNDVLRSKLLRRAALTIACDAIAKKIQSSCSAHSVPFPDRVSEKDWKTTTELEAVGWVTKYLGEKFSYRALFVLYAHKNIRDMFPEEFLMLQALYHENGEFHPRDPFDEDQVSKALEVCIITKTGFGDSGLKLLQVNRIFRDKLPEYFQK